MPHNKLARFSPVKRRKSERAMSCVGPVSGLHPRSITQTPRRKRKFILKALQVTTFGMGETFWAIVLCRNTERWLKWSQSRFLKIKSTPHTLRGGSRRGRMLHRVTPLCTSCFLMWGCDERNEVRCAQHLETSLQWQNPKDDWGMLWDLPRAMQFKTTPHAKAKDDKKKRGKETNNNRRNKTHSRPFLFRSCLKTIASAEHHVHQPFQWLSTADSPQFLIVPRTIGGMSMAVMPLTKPYQITGERQAGGEIHWLQ